jgi:hypothetical protein
MVAWPPVILYRGKEFEEDELDAAKAAGFDCITSRMDILAGDLVIPRYSALPFYKELEHDVEFIGAKLINSYRQHRYVADLQNWYHDLEDLTPRTWFRASDVPLGEPGCFVLKGETNSKKFQFKESMFAESRAHIGHVLGRLQDDSLISQQNIYVRKFERFKTYAWGLHGLPITREFRFFAAYGKILSGGYYWSSHIDQFLESGHAKEEFDPACVPTEFLENVVACVSSQVNFVVIDVAQAMDGQWRVVELNDGQMSGLSENDPSVLYPALMKAIKENVNITG